MPAPSTNRPAMPAQPRVRFVTGDPLGTPALEQRSFHLRHPGVDVIHLCAFPRGRLELTLIGLILVVVSIGLPAAYLVNGGGGTGPLSKSDAWGALLAALVGSGLGLGILIPGIRGTFSADAVFDQLPTDATHVKLVEGGPERHFQLAGVIDRLSFHVVEEDT